MLDDASVPACECEEQIVAALGAGYISEELAAHIEQCAVCQEVKLVFGFLQSASTLQEESPVSTAGLIWWRAKLYEKRALAARSVKPIRTVQIVATVLVSAVVAILAAVAGPAWIGKASPLVISVVICGCALIVSAAGFWVALPHGRGSLGLPDNGWMAHSGRNRDVTRR